MIDPKTGKLPGPDTRSPFLEAFRAGTAPKEAETTAPDGSPDATSPDFYDLNP